MAAHAWQGAGNHVLAAEQFDFHCLQVTSAQLHKAKEADAKARAAAAEQDAAAKNRTLTEDSYAALVDVSYFSQKPPEAPSVKVFPHCNTATKQSNCRGQKAHRQRGQLRRPGRRKILFKIFSPSSCSDAIFVW